MGRFILVSTSERGLGGGEVTVEPYRGLHLIKTCSEVPKIFRKANHASDQHHLGRYARKEGEFPKELRFGNF